MNAITSYVRDEWRSVRPGRPLPRELRCFLKTPRFRESGHVLCFVFADDAPDPDLVVKVSRLPGEDRWIDREASNLRNVQAARFEGFDSIPRAVAYDDRPGFGLLVQTVVPGETMGRATVRRRPRACLDAVTDWLIDLHLATASASGPDSIGRLVEAPLGRLEAVDDVRPADRELVRLTRDATASLATAAIPLVFEHGDLGAPNILLDAGDRVGVVDWELADPLGLPAADLFFFLAFVAFARGRAGSRRGRLAAFRSAFFGRRAWATPWIRRYAEALDLPPDVLESLFIATWARRVATAADRLGVVDASLRGTPEVAGWPAGDRFHPLWEHAVVHRKELSL